MADFRYETGRIGKYKGLEVYTISKKEFEENFDTYKFIDVMYAVTNGSCNEIPLVYQGKIRAHMDKWGNVKDRRDYIDYVCPVKKEKVKEKEEIKVKEERKEKKESFKEFIAPSVDEILHTAIFDDWYLELLYHD